MSQTVSEIAKEITIAAIQNNVFRENKSAGSISTEELNKINAEQLGKFYKTISKHVNQAISGKFED
ncbi:hypothetical protein D3C73_1084970 [compost metagenome]